MRNMIELSETTTRNPKLMVLAREKWNKVKSNWADVETRSEVSTGDRIHREDGKKKTKNKMMMLLPRSAAF